MDIQNAQDTELKHQAITKTVIGCAFEVINELGAGFLECVYERALLLALRQKGLAVVPQHPATVMFRGECVGDFYADLFVEDKVIIDWENLSPCLP
jgi:GxxExxY protein